MKLEFYKLPFKSSFYDNWVYDANGDFAFQIEDTSYTSFILETLNGYQSQHLDVLTLSVNDKNSNIILNKGKPFISMRLPYELSEKELTYEQFKDIQYDLRDWIIYKLTNK